MTLFFVIVGLTGAALFARQLCIAYDDPRYDSWHTIVLLVLSIALATAGLVGGILFGVAFPEENAFAARCHTAAGHVLDIDRGGELCLTDDGRVLFHG